MQMEVEELINDTRMGRHHVVILGAGASRQAFPRGDGNGNKLPLMCDLVEITGLNSELSKYGVEYKGKNFETICSDLYQDSKYSGLVDFIESRIWDYFSNMVLPSYPTLYDHLVLSLRDKDLIATFNWDPLLYRACWRNHEKTTLPHICYLHGNVAVGYCTKDKQYGYIKDRCPICGNYFTPSKLLYPIEKNYSQEASIKLEWDDLRNTLNSAFVLTIFGYSAPQSDIEAIRLMKDAWLANTTGDINQVELIDTKHEDELIETWRGFTPYHHYNITEDFYSSSIGLFPRRTCEAEWNASMECKFLEINPIPKNLGLKELLKWYESLIEAENKKAQT